MKKQLGLCKNEKDVENIYRKELSNNIKDSIITSPYGCDGLLEAKNIRSLLEFKYNESLKNKLSQSNILIQCLYYLKKFELSGEKLPTTILVGDTNECFSLHTNAIVKYLSSPIDWKIAPSDAYKNNPEIIQAMVNDIDILPFVFDVDEKFHINTIIDKIKDLSDSVVRKIRITEHNLCTIFDYFEKNVLGDKCLLSVNEKANLFIQIIISPENNYLHPKKKNTLITKSYGELIVNQNLFISFFKHFEGDVYSPSEKQSLTGFIDRLIEDTKRRKSGEFFTPTPFVNLAHKYISDVFGIDWKERFIVIDCAFGTGNLTRDYNFKELYCSTLEQSDIDTANQMKYNESATKFQFDFLNDELFDTLLEKSKIPIPLQEAINNGKEILFFINPPYATANVKGSNSKSKKNVAKTKQNKSMLIEGWGKSSQNLYAQFLYRITKIQEINKNIKIAVFCPPLFLSGSSYKQFRKKFLNSFGFQKGFLFEAKHFADVSANWGISFTIFNNIINNNKYNLDVVDFNKNFELEKIGEKEIYNTDNCISASEWIRKEIKGLKTFDAPQISSPCAIKTFGRGMLTNNAIGYIQFASNNIAKNNQQVSLMSGAFSNGNGLSIITENFYKTVSSFSARRLISGQYANWVNCKDEYLAPNEDHPYYQQFTYDSIVYSLFNNSSQQSSLRKINYKNKQWDITNQFFWMDKNDIIQLAEENNYDELYRDAKNNENRFVYNKLFGEEYIYNKLSLDAKLILDKATELVKKSIKMRKIVSSEHPEYHLDSFDCGYAQLKLVWKEYFKEEFNEFRKLYKNLETRLIPMVYELGFLRK